MYIMTSQPSTLFAKEPWQEFSYDSPWVRGWKNTITNEIVYFTENSIDLEIEDCDLRGTIGWMLVNKDGSIEQVSTDYYADLTTAQENFCSDYLADELDLETNL